MSRQPLVVGNWKMNGDEKLLLAHREVLQNQAHRAQIAICPPYVYLPAAQLHLKQTQVAYGAQDVSAHAAGAYTGEIAASMLKGFGCTYVIVGHSERRQYWGETHQQVAEKFKQALLEGLTPILCVGETLTQREAGETENLLRAQLDAVIAWVGIESLHKAVLAYEPVWAIGTGLAATPEQAQTVHQFIRAHLQQQDETLAKKMIILYGGSVNAENAKALFSMPDIDGGLIGGASLKPEVFASIVAAAL